jgi:hypothetical protein
MRLKPAEVLLGIVLIGMGVMGMGEKELFHYDVPIPYPKTFSTICLIFGVIWLVVPWYVRSHQNKNN